MKAIIIFYTEERLKNTMRKLRRMVCAWSMMLVSVAPALAQENQKLALTNTPGMFNHLDLSVDLGTTGIGFDLAMPVGDYVQLRTGFDFMPKFHHNMSFKVQVGDPNEQDESQSSAKFERLANMLEGFTGYRVDDHIDMVGEPTFNNFKFLVDVFPFKNNKHWHFTAGFYLGSSKVAKACNTMEDMPSLMAVAIYNNMYDKISSGEGIIFNVGDYSLPIFNDPELEDRILSYGRMGIHVGDMRADKTPYMMVPDENNMVRTTIKVNPFRPYIGFGYGGKLLKGDDRYHVSFDCGMMMWGGTPKILTHDGTDLANEVENIRGKVGDYVDLIKVFKVYPVLQLRLTRRLF